jgi:predicted lactoylglutathione lyase
VLPRLSVVTLGARNVATVAGFYRSLGWPAVVDTEEFVCFQLSGALLAVFGLKPLGADAHAIPAAPERGLRGFSLAINVDERQEVDETIEAVRAAGARITKEPIDAELFVGRSAYFADPEDNHWEVVWLPPDSDVAVAARRAVGLPS